MDVHKISMVALAEHFAQTYHKGQKYAGGTYYHNHLSQVAKVVSEKNFGVDNSKALTVALLHDILEDTKCTKTILSTFFPEDVVEAVVLLTKTKGYKEADYFNKIRSNSLARKVKIADMCCNLNQSLKEGDKRRITKYGRQLPMLFEDEFGA